MTIVPVLTTPKPVLEKIEVTLTPEEARLISNLTVDFKTNNNEAYKAISELRTSLGNALRG